MGLVKRKKKAERCDPAEPEAVTTRRKAVRRENCREFLQEEVAKVLPQVIEKARDEVLGGNLSAFQKLWSMSGLDKQEAKERRKRGGLGAQILRRLKKPEGKPGGRARSATGQFVAREK